MSASQPLSWAGYFKFVLLLLLVSLGLMGLGYLPATNLAGADGVPAMLAGVAASLLASALGGLVLLISPIGKPADSYSVMMGFMAARTAVLVLIGASLALSGLFALKPLLLSTAASHLVLLIVDTLLTVRLARTTGSAASEAKANERTSRDEPA